MSPDQHWSCLPAVLTSYNGRSGNVRPLIKIQYHDGSHIDFPEIHNVPIINPATAFAGVRLPVRVGDKVVLHIADRDIQKLLKSSTSGLSDPGSSLTATRRCHNITDAIAYVGFASNSSLHYASDKAHDVWIFNNSDSDSYNHIRLKSDGDVEVKTDKATLELKKDGDIELTNDACELSLKNDGDIELSNESCSVNMAASGTINIANALNSINLGILGMVTITCPISLNILSPMVFCAGDVSVLNGSIHLSTHTHGGVLPGPSVTAPPTNPS